MQNQELKLKACIVAASLLLANSASAFDMGKMMNPSKWMGGNKDRDRYDDYYGGPGYGYPGGPPGYGYGYGGAPGYGPPGSGCGGAPGCGPPGYGDGGAASWGAAPAVGDGGAPAGGAPASGSARVEVVQW